MSPTSLSLLPLIAEAELAGLSGHVAALGVLYPQTRAEAAPWGEGVLLFAGTEGAPLNWGFGLLDDDVAFEPLLRQAEAFYAERGAPAAITWFPDATPSLRAVLQRSGFGPLQTLQVHVAALPLSLGGPQPGPVLAEHTDDTDLWVTTVAAGFRGGAAGSGPDDMETMLTRAAVRPDVRLFLARLDGEPVGGGALHCDQRIGLLFSGSVLPAYRGRGAQRALMHARLVAAIGEGLQFAVSIAAPESVPARNLQRMGFDALFLRETWVLER